MKAEDTLISISTAVDLENNAYKIGRQAGIREVVEWMKEVQVMELMSYNFQCILKPSLNKKLKEWGIDG